MDLATDSVTTTSTRRVWIGVTVMTWACLVVPGCARMRSHLAHEEHPAFGTDTVATTKGTVASTRGRAGTSSGRDTTRQGSAPTDEPGEGALVAESGNRPLVALLPPESLPIAEPAPETRTGGEAPPALQPIDAASSPRPEPVEPNVAAAATSPARGPTLEGLLAGSRRRLDGITSYRVTMNLQERVAGTLRPAEDVVLNIRRQPRAVRLEWPNGPNKGREVIFAADANDGLMLVHMANALIPQIKMAPDSPLATQNSRHPITEAGYDTIVENMERAFRSQEAGDPSLGKIRYDGLETPESLSKPCHKIVRVTPTKETWIVYLDPENDLPVLVQATDGNGDRLEHFVFRDLSFNPSDLAAADAFNPEARWGPSRGLFQRLARAGTATPKAVETR